MSRHDGVDPTAQALNDLVLTLTALLDPEPHADEVVDAVRAALVGKSPP